MTCFRDLPVLVTGGAGFIGSNLVHRLVDLGSRVHVIDCLHPEHGGNLFNLAGVENHIRFIEADIVDVSTHLETLGDVEVIFDLAGQVSHIDSMTDPLGDAHANVTSHVSMFEALRQREMRPHVIYTSTRQVYGHPQSLPVREDHPITPVDANGINKHSGEQYLGLYQEAYGFKGTVLRLTNTYGPRQLIAHERQGAMGWFLHQAILGESISLFGGGEVLRDFCYVDDAVDALLAVADCPEAMGRVFNVGGVETSLKEVAGMLVEIAGKGSVQTVPFPPARARIAVPSVISDYSALTEACGWRPRQGLRAGLKRTYGYYAQFKEHYL